MRSQDIVRIVRGRAGITQQQLADRSGRPRETIARWESGAREPSLATLTAVVEACGLELVMHLAERDPSLDALVADQVALSAPERLARLMPTVEKEEGLRALRWLAGVGTPVIVIGVIAAVLQGGPQRPGGARVEFVTGDPIAMEAEMRDAGLVPIDSDERWVDVDRRASWIRAEGGTVALASNVPGTRDYPDLRRSARSVELDGGTTIAVAHPRDLLRMADASGREADWARVPGLRALLSASTRGGPPA